VSVPFTVVAAGDAALVVQLEDRVDPELNAWCVALATALPAALGAAVRDAVVGYTSVTVYFDPLHVDRDWLEDQIGDLAERLESSAASTPSGMIEVPVAYGGEEGPDLADVALFAGCSEAEVVHLHTAREYRVYLVGFVPGFAYMAEVDSRIAAPRRSTPRTALPAGSVAIAGVQTGIYPVVTPGGWNIIGRTEVRPFDPDRAEPSLFRAGDRVRFRALNASPTS
jgi:inhibitor of KinA